MLRYDFFSAKLFADGEVTKGSRRKPPQVVPYWRLMRQAEETIRQLESELCIAPLRRGRAGKVQIRRIGLRPIDKYLHRSERYLRPRAG